MRSRSIRVDRREDRSAARHGGRDLGRQICSRTNPALDHELNIRRRKQIRVIPVRDRGADGDVREIRRQLTDGVRRVTCADNFDGNSLTADAGGVDERLEPLRVAKVPGVEEANGSAVGVWRARRDSVDVRPVVDRLDLVWVGAACGEVLAEAGTAHDYRVGRMNRVLLESTSGCEDA